jgi:hypothetical protein
MAHKELGMEHYPSNLPRALKWSGERELDFLLPKVPETLSIFHDLDNHNPLRINEFTEKQQEILSKILSNGLLSESF